MSTIQLQRRSSGKFLWQCVTHVQKKIFCDNTSKVTPPEVTYFHSRPYKKSYWIKRGRESSTSFFYVQPLVKFYQPTLQVISYIIALIFRYEPTSPFITVPASFISCYRPFLLPSQRPMYWHRPSRHRCLLQQSPMMMMLPMVYEAC